MPKDSEESKGRLRPSLRHLMILDRVTLDTSVLVGPRSLDLAIAARQRYYRGHWSNWIVAEVSRVRTEMVIRRARRELGITRENEADERIQDEVERRLLRSRTRVNRVIDDFSRLLTNVNYHEAEGADLSWLRDRDDIAVMQTAIAAGVPGVLVTDNTRELPIGEVRNGVLIVSGEMFLQHIFETYPESQEVIERQAETHRQALREGRLPPYL